MFIVEKTQYVKATHPYIHLAKEVKNGKNILKIDQNNHYIIN